MNLCNRCRMILALHMLMLFCIDLVLIKSAAGQKNKGGRKKSLKRKFYLWIHTKTFWCLNMGLWQIGNLYWCKCTNKHDRKICLQNIETKLLRYFFNLNNLPISAKEIVNQGWSHFLFVGHGMYPLKTSRVH